MNRKENNIKRNRANKIWQPGVSPDLEDGQMIWLIPRGPLERVKDGLCLQKSTDLCRLRRKAYGVHSI